MLELRITDGNETHDEATEKDDVTLGRAPNNDVVLPDKRVSRQHARLLRRDGGLYIQDLGGANGTQVRDQLLHNETATVTPGEAIVIGPYEVSVETSVPVHGESVERSLVPPPEVNQQVRKAWESKSTSHVRAIGDADGVQQRYVIPHAPDAARIRLGRAPTNDLVLGSPSVSLEHAVIERSSAGSQWSITSLSSTVPTFVNNVPVRQRGLTEGDVIRIGPYSLVVQNGEIEYVDKAAGILLQALNLSKRVGKKTILHDVSLIIQPREFVAIVGVSGSGKTTLLNASSGISPATSGEVLLNGYQLYDHFASFRSEIGYVPQDDIVHGELPVERALRYSAQLRMPADTSKSEREKRVDNVIAELGLDQQRKTVINKLSGGQRKRVSIGVELLTRPPLFFLDEPTSGLDPVTDSHMMDLLRKLADQGRTILLVTHATRDISMCDKVTFLTRGGRLAYFGGPRDALQYFGAAEFEEIYDQIENEYSPEEWEERFRQSPDYQSEITTPLVQLQAMTLPSESRPRPDLSKGNGRQVTGVWRQFGILTRRYVDTMVRDRKHLAILLLQAPIIGLLLWGLFSRSVFEPPINLEVFAWHAATPSVLAIQRDPETNRLINVPPDSDLVAISGRDCSNLTSGNFTVGTECHVAAGNGNSVALKAAQLAFLLAAVAVWLGTLNAIREISKENAIYRRERMVNLRIMPYVASKLAVLWFLVVVQSGMLLGVTAGYVNIPVHIVAATFASLILAGAASVAVALAVSAAVTNSDRAIVLAPLIMVPQILFAGGLTPVRDLGVVKPFSAIVATRWSYEAIGRVFVDVNLAGIAEQFQQTPALTGQPYIPWVVLGAFIIAFSGLALVLQKLKDRH